MSASKSKSRCCLTGFDAKIARILLSERIPMQKPVFESNNSVPAFCIGVMVLSDDIRNHLETETLVLHWIASWCTDSCQSRFDPRCLLLLVALWLRQAR